MIKSRYQKMYTEKYKQDMDFVIIGDNYIGPFVNMDVAQKAVNAINGQFSQQPKRTRTEYERVTFDEDYEHLCRMIKGESFYDCRGEIEYKFNGYGFVCTQGCDEYHGQKWDSSRPSELYQKVEKEIDERQEFIERAKNLIDASKEADYSLGKMYDSGCRFVGANGEIE